MGLPQHLEEWIDGATICRQSSAVGFVWSLYESCLHLFAELVQLVSKKPSTASAKAVLNEEVGRLLSWGDGFENGELDKALERDPELKSTALEYLSSLGALLANKLFMVSTFNDVRGRPELEAKAVELRSLVHNAKTIIDESEDDESDLESEMGARSSKKAILDEVALDIKFYNLRLMDLLPSIERTALQPKDAIESKNDSNTVASVPFQVSKPAHSYVLQVMDKFPQADNKLVERLGQANWERRKRIREVQAVPLDTTISEPAKSIFVPVSMFHDSGLGSSIPAASAYAQTAASHSSFRTSATESQVGSYRVPPTPREVFDGKPFTCEICGHVLKKIKNRVDWKIHVFADLKPYICTSSSCLDELSTFPTRQMWADHEFRKHRSEKSWRCYLCSALLSSAGLWDDHVKQIHETNLNREEFQKAISIAEINEDIPVESQACPMCLKVGIMTRKEFVTHVAKHMESISLAALPRDADSDSGSDLERGRDSVESEDAGGTSRSAAPDVVDIEILWERSLYQEVTTGPDGLYHCPWEGKDPACNHKPEKLKSNYDKFVDSHLKPYRCKVHACENARFSSTACLIRHECEAHAMHGYGERPYLCTFEGCERGLPGNGFHWRWNLSDHMKRVHNRAPSPLRGTAKFPRIFKKPKSTVGSSRIEEPNRKPSARRQPQTARVGQVGRVSKAARQSQASSPTPLVDQ